MISSITSHLYGCLDALLKKFGLKEASFLPTNKVEDDEQTRLYQMDKFDFRTSNMFLVPMVALLIISISCFIGGIYRVLSVGDWDKMFIQLLLPAYIIVVNSPIIEGLVIRKDVGRIYPSAALNVTSNKYLGHNHHFYTLFSTKESVKVPSISPKIFVQLCF